MSLHARRSSRCLGDTICDGFGISFQRDRRANVNLSSWVNEGWFWSSRR